MRRGRLFCLAALQCEKLLKGEGMEALAQVMFGRWPSARLDAPDPLAWQVLRESASSQLLICRDIIEQWPLLEAHDAPGNDAVFDWLNGSFAELAFNAEERKRIEGNIRLLTCEEAAALGTDGVRAAKPSAYAASRGADAWWWLDAPGGRDDHAACVLPSGHIGAYGSPRHCINGVRPVLHLRAQAGEEPVLQRRQCGTPGMALRYGDHAQAARLLDGQDLTDDALRLGLSGGYAGQQAFARLLKSGTLSQRQTVALWHVAKSHASALKALVHNVDLNRFEPKESLLLALVEHELLEELPLLEGHEGYFTPGALEQALNMAMGRDFDLTAYLLERKKACSQPDPFAAFDI